MKKSLVIASCFAITLVLIGCTMFGRAQAQPLLRPIPPGDVPAPPAMIEPALAQDHARLYAFALQANPHCESPDHVLSRTCYMIGITEEARVREIAGGMPARYATGNEVRDKDDMVTQHFFDEALAGRQ